MKNFLQNLFGGAGARRTKPVVLVIMDGWGIAPASAGNVTTSAKLPNLDKYFAQYPNTQLIASGESVGLPANEVGNTEVGHLTIGSGRVIYQGLKRSNMASEDGSFLQNQAFLKAIQHARNNNSRLHIMGLVTSGNVHSSLPHLYNLLTMCRQAQLTNVALHAFTDGRDAPPKEGLEILSEVEKRMQSFNIGQIATIAGRYYAMDRDLRWERIERAYQAIVEGKGPTSNSTMEAIRSAYDAGLSDELIEPTVILKDGAPYATVNDNDAVIFFNFRIDRPRELTMALTMPNFEQLNPANYGYNEESNDKNDQKIKFSGTFTRNKIPQNVFMTTMMNYHKNIPVNAVAYDYDFIGNPLAQVLSDHGLEQLHQSESEKERFVTYYFDGYRDECFPGEDTVIVPSPKVPTYDRKPEMSVFHTVSEFKRNLEKDRYHFFVMNFANPDMVAHTGNIKATIQACEATDKAIGEVVDATLAVDGTVFITADHGNAEELLTYDSSSFFFTSSAGSVNTDHSSNPVPFIIVNNEKRQRVKIVRP